MNDNMNEFGTLVPKRFVENLQAENISLKAELERLRKFNDEALAHIAKEERKSRERLDMAEAEIELLRKAGDAMADAFASSLASEYGDGSESLKNKFLNDKTRNEFADWNAAKEGKPSK